MKTQLTWHTSGANGGATAEASMKSYIPLIKLERNDIYIYNIHTLLVLVTCFKFKLKG